MRIVDLDPGDEQLVRAVAGLLVEGFAENWPDAWPDLASGVAEVRESFGEDRISRIAVGEDGTVLGWIVASASMMGTCGSCTPWS
jgi:aminoglycoside 6'-N-acetyltransferase I